MKFLQYFEHFFWDDTMQRFFGLRSLAGAVVFYSIFPLPPHWPIFERIARWATLVGGILGLILWAFLCLWSSCHGDPGLGMVLTTCLWCGLTGGLHFDGAMDTADGLAVTNPERRLQTMSDSCTGAFGVMAAITIFALKTAALLALSPQQWIALPFILGWARWAQLWAIVVYPYLKTQGKGQFHQHNLHPYQDLGLALSVLLLGHSLLIWGLPQPWYFHLVLLTTPLWGAGWSHYFYRRFGGHTGDIYGAIVEWTEVFGLISIGLL